MLKPAAGSLTISSNLLESVATSPSPSSCCFLPCAVPAQVGGIDCSAMASEESLVAMVPDIEEPTEKKGKISVNLLAPWQGKCHGCSADIRNDPTTTEDGKRIANKVGASRLAGCLQV